MNITLAMICICSSTSGLKLTDCTNVVASKYFRWQDLCQAGLEMAFCTFLFLAINQPKTKVVKRYTLKNGWIHYM